MTETIFDISLLNDEQRMAVQETEGAVLVVAGAGTGKTKVLTSRIAYIVSSGLCTVDEILAVTFTNKAAKEMGDRATALLSGADIYFRFGNRPWIGTFHSLALRIIRPLHEKFYRTANFSIIDATDQLRIVKKIMHDLGFDDKKHSPKSMVYYINKWKDQCQTVDYAKKNAQKFSNEELASKIYAHYQDLLRSLDTIDFGDILMYCLEIFAYNSDTLKEYQNKFKYIMIDEYQDTNMSQYLWIKMLSQGHGNICCVGDDDQAIYSWRGADIGNILKFENSFKNAKVIRLGKNYRSTGNILKTASTLISNNEMRMQKSFWTDEEAGLPVIIKVLHDSVEEAQFVAALIANKYKNGVTLNDMAILVRATFQTRAFEERLLAMGVPYTVIGGMRFYERKEVKDAIAYLRLAMNPDDGIAFDRIVNLPKRGIGSTTIAKFYDIAREQNISIPKAARQVSKKLEDFFNQVDRWREMIGTESLKDIMERILNESGYLAMLRGSKNLEDEARLETLDELLSSLHDFSDPAEFLDYVGLVLDHTSAKIQERVVISTIHASKGLEFRIVFIPGFEENIIPHQRSIMEKGELGVEEERRLCYVAITRAKKEAYITLCQARKMFGLGGGWNYSRPSRFLQNLPKESVKIL
ncbi:MAG: UvrD-helicase domain-containing protein [Holosporales bacterium]|jgi:DNA helicase-2/ATP-dependent DNA helicase PcrA|nr:UvrD-helicase domain-containing protein [Holosporales bacterium]